MGSGLSPPRGYWITDGIRAEPSTPEVGPGMGSQLHPKSRDEDMDGIRAETPAQGWNDGWGQG